MLLSFTSVFVPKALFGKVSLYNEIILADMLSFKDVIILACHITSKHIQMLKNFSNLMKILINQFIIVNSF